MQSLEYDLYRFLTYLSDCWFFRM